MWFKQITCDNCFTPLENVGRHNNYILLTIIANKNMPYNYYSNEGFNYQHQFPFAFMSCNQMKPNGHIFMYSVSQQDMRLSNRTYFCSNQCAYKYATENNCLMLYYDEILNSVRVITPHMIQVNRELGGSDYRGLNVQQPQEWIIPKNSFADLRMYNRNIIFPELKYPYKLTFYRSQDEFDYQNLLLDKNFQYSFYGSNNFPEERVKNIKQHVKLFELNFGRRLGIEWIIRDNDRFIGFIRMNCTNPNDFYNWHLEFGLIKNMRGKGIMTNALKSVSLRASTPSWFY